ncbi:cytochrome P450 [Salinisphaera aquimarina]|uniref:Cytochrome P450 n=1 Tax=Salinisphaera aquimarina TaxID=2094031 RepID=A0ABV7EV94_9GAMM
MSISVSDLQHRARIAGPIARFSIGPDDATRAMLCRWHSAFGDIYRVRPDHGDAEHWVVHDPEAVQQILVRNSRNYSKGMGLDRVKILLGNGIMVSEADFWARQRRLIQPAFKPRALADFNAMIFDENVVLAKRWSQFAAAREPLDVAAEISELTLVIVLKSIFGEDYADLIAGGANPFALLSEAPERNLRFAARFHRLRKVVESIIDKRLGAPRQPFDFLGHMLAARSRDGEAMTHRELVDEVLTLIVAGHETTASALAWGWYLIATHPEVGATLQAAADAIDMDALRRDGGHRNDAFAWFDATVNETLRLYPPGWLLSRRALAPDRLGGYDIEPGTQLFISPYVLHRHGDYWQDPECFDPTRFIDGEQPAHRFAYVPFAAGPRHCVGEQMALTEMRVHLAVMIRAFTPCYVAAHPPQIESHINLRPADGVRLQLISQ